MARPKAPTSGASDIPISGKLVKTVIGSFTQPPYKGDDSWPMCSIGVARNSIVATDSNSAIIIGEPAEHHAATQRKEALLAAERANLYGDPVAIDEIERKLDKESGEVETMPYVQQVIKKNLATMKPIASVDPVALAAIGKVAAAAGALSVDLFQPEKDPSALGFRFVFYPDPEHINLFSTYEGENIEARGVFRASAASRSRSMDADEEDSPETAGAQQPARKRKKAEAKKELPEPQAAAVVAETVPEPEPEPVDIHAKELRGEFVMPPLDVLSKVDSGPADPGDYREAILTVLRERNLPGRIIGAHAGPTVTLYELDIPASASVKKIAALADDFQMQLGVRSVRIQAPIPGKKAIGIEIPNKKPRMVSLFELCSQREFVDAKSRLVVALGQDISGRPVYADLPEMPHLLIAGATNSGKSIGIATLLSSLLLRAAPSELRLVLIDPKQVELSLFDRIPHLACPVVTEVMEVPGVLSALVREMERRYELLKEKQCRNIASWNEKVAEPERLPYFVVVIDELADLMMQAGGEVEPQIVRLAQKARAVGIHLVVATQRPSADIITGLIKANVPSRIAFSVASGVDSGVILDQRGAEKLLGKGDMLFKPVEAGERATRVQGAYVSEAEVEQICKYWRDQAPAKFDFALREKEVKADDDADEEELYKDAVDFAREQGQISTAMLQRRFSIGFQRASKILDRMEAEKVCGPRDGPRPRTVLTLEEVGAN